jgi:hypothetical protein
MPPGRLAASGRAERAVLTLGRWASDSGGGSSEYLIFEHEGELYRAQPHPDTGERVWSRWPSGEVCACPMDEVE